MEATDMTPEQVAAEFAESLIQAVRPNRAGRRQEDRNARHELGRIRVRSYEHDQAMMKRKRSALRRQNGDPIGRNAALIDWMDRIDSNRTPTIVYGEVE